MGNHLFGGGNADAEEEQDDERLRRWRPAQGHHLYGAFARKKQSSKSSESSDEGSGGSDGQSVASSAEKLDSESEKSESHADDKSDKSGGQEGQSSDEDDEIEEGKELARTDDKKKKKVVVRMEFEPLLALHEPLPEDMQAPAELFAQTRRKRKVERAEKAALEDARAQFRRKARAVAEWMLDMGLDEVKIAELARALGEDIDELRYALVQSGRFTVDDDGDVRRALPQKIMDIMESDIETLQEVVDKLLDVSESAVRAAVSASNGELRLKLANDIELIERVDVEAEEKMQRDEERERRMRQKEEKRRAKTRKKRGAKSIEDEEDKESESSSSGEEGGTGVNKEAEKKALAFRRLQVQRKIEEFLKVYTKGQNLTKINAKGKRYHRRVYVDTSRKALVVQGANGPKFFPFASMKEVDIETRTTKEGRVETLVICAIEKRGRIVKELNLAFTDQARANTFVNCVTLFSLALRHAQQKR
mmetsp:Transcript_29886/g.86879  ORF Transcript_29886/g.86879 Transcript_29886/m.86879 type:complete len:477 (-) Transcript_29886:88-1518(-)